MDLTRLGVAWAATANIPSPGAFAIGSLTARADRPQSAPDLGLSLIETVAYIADVLSAAPAQVADSSGVLLGTESLGSSQPPRRPGWTNLLRNYTYAEPVWTLGRHGPADGPRNLIPSDGSVAETIASARRRRHGSTRQLRRVVQTRIYGRGGQISYVGQLALYERGA